MLNAEWMPGARLSSSEAGDERRRAGPRPCTTWRGDHATPAAAVWPAQRAGEPGRIGGRPPDGAAASIGADAADVLKRMVSKSQPFVYYLTISS